MSHREYYVCAAEATPSANAHTMNKIECVALATATAESECFFTDVDRSLCKYIPGDGAKKTVFEWKYPGYTIGTAAKPVAAADLSMPKSVAAAVGGMK